jgi:hypothetical protein
MLVLGSVGLAAMAKGSIAYKGKSGATNVAVRHAYLVKGPDLVTKQPIRRIVLSVADVSAALRGCATMLCSDGGIREGMTIDLDSGPRINYWFVANDQRIQYSGSARPDTLTLTSDTAERVAGRWVLDQSAAGGPTLDITFDAPLVKTIGK